MRSSRHTKPVGLTLVELLVVFGIVTLLMVLLFPAVQSARASARATSCRNNLKQMGLGLANYHSARGHFPPGSDLLAGTEFAWSAHLLPYLEYSSISEQIDFGLPWNAVGENAIAADMNLPIYSCPNALALFNGKQDYGGIIGTSLLSLNLGFGPFDAFGTGTLIITHPDQPQPVKSSSILDGLSNTLCVGESVDRLDDEAARWACGKNCFAQNEKWINVEQSDSLHSHHLQGAHGLFADGHVKLLTEDIQTEVLGALCTRNAGDRSSESIN